MDNQSSCLKGHVKVTLSNPTTGKRHIVEQDNTVTTAVYDIFKYNIGGMVCGEYTSPLYLRCFGGILGYDENIDLKVNDPTDYNLRSYPSFYAGQDQYVQGYGLRRCLGSLVDTQISGSSVTQVWEWDEHHGGGSLKNIALCPSSIGQRGNYLYSQYSEEYSTGYYWYKANNFSPYTIPINHHSSVYSDNNRFHYSEYPIMGYYNNIGYSFSVSASGVLDLYLHHLDLYNSHLYNVGASANSFFTETKTVQLGHKFIDNNNCMFHFDWENNRLLIFSVYTEDDISDLTPQQITMDAIDLTSFTASSDTVVMSDVEYFSTLRYNDTNNNYISYEYPLQAVVIGNILMFPTVYGKNQPEPSALAQILIPGLHKPAGTDYPEVNDHLTLNGFFYITNIGQDSPSDVKIYECCLPGAVVVTGGPGGWFAYKTATKYSSDIQSYCGMLFRLGYNATIYCSSKFGGGTHGITPAYLSKVHSNIYIGDTNSILINNMFMSTKCELPETIYKTQNNILRIEYTLTEV